MKYGFNLNKLVDLLLPFWLRKPNRVKLYISLMEPVRSLYNEFIEFKREVDFKTQYSCQQKSLESLLNKKFDPVLKRIKIITSSDLKEIYYSFNSGEVNPSLIHGKFSSEVISTPRYSFNSEELTSSFRFVVRIPSALDEDSTKAQMKAWVNYYRFQSFNFKFLVV
jgi:hypothetical protein